MSNRSADPTVTAALAGYDLWSSSYDERDNPMVAISDLAMDAWPLELGGRAVVELGCGTGRNAARCLRAGAARYLGLDGSSGMLARARARGLDARAVFEQAELGADGPGLAGAFDVALVCLVLEHVRDPAPALAQAARLVRGGGELAVYELDAARHAAGVAAHFDHGGREVRLPSYAHDEAELAAALAATGFDVLATRRWYASAAAIARSAKLARYTGQPVLLELQARRRAA
jgi:SAM-dependent methyltransferase